MKTVAAGVRPANPTAYAPTPLELLRIRVALIERINAAAEKAKWGRNPESEGTPSRLFAAGCFLAAHGFDNQQCVGERWNGEPLCRSICDGSLEILPWRKFCKHCGSLLSFFFCGVSVDSNIMDPQH